MFDVDFLNELRAFETEKVVRLIPPGTKTILEVGGGTGEQARILEGFGFSVTSVDIKGSTYADHQVFPITEYDGRTLPFEDDSFDFIFSSNVLEHISEISAFQKEMFRVLKPGRQCLHIMPTGSWSFWTALAHFADMPSRLWYQVKHEGSWGVPKQGLADHPTARKKFAFLSPLRLIRLFKFLFTRNKGYFFPKRHGEKHFLLAEVFSFSPFCWRLFFWKNGATVNVLHTRLFYTGYMVLGRSLSFRVRRWLSFLLGDAVKIYIVTERKRHWQ